MSTGDELHEGPDRFAGSKTSTTATNSQLAHSARRERPLWAIWIPAAVTLLVMLGGAYLMVR